MKQSMFFDASHSIFENAKQLRKNMTEAEKLLLASLKKNIKGFKFRSQHPIGIYIADFYCHKMKLVIELDGSIHDNEEIKRNDIERQQWLEHQGLIVVRFKNEEIVNDIDTVLKTIETYLLTK
jgi:imidazole glycerol-phosphate synthase subunit HisF